MFGAAAAGIGAELVPDSRQSGFTVNDAQRVDPVLAGQLAKAAELLAADVKQRAAELAPCADAAAGGQACATTFIQTFGEKVYRRPLAEDEVTQLLTVYGVGAEGASYGDGIELVVRALLQSAAFLYLTELGEAPGAAIKLTPDELAASISYLIQGRPPKPELLQAARSGLLDTPEQRYAAVQGLLTTEARDRVVRVVREWLGTDRLANTAKDTNVYPDFPAVKDSMDRETTEFLQVLMYSKGGLLKDLLSANWTMADTPLAAAYGKSVAGGVGVFSEISVPDRLGILNQGAFLSVFSHAHETAPVLRGVALMRRVACIPLADPVNLTRAVVPPAPDPTQTTRARFSVHSADPECAICHEQIDNFGFAFEGLDGMGKFRALDNGHEVDRSVVISGTDFDGSYADSNELVSAMAESQQVRECFARHAFRALSGRSDAEVKPSEDEFVNYWKSQEQAAAGHITETLLAYVKSPAFPFRRAQ